MFNLTEQEIREILHPIGVLGQNGKKITGVSIDSRSLKPGELFIAIKGDQFDGHQFIQEVVQKGASGFVFSDEIDLSGIGGDTIGFKVLDTLKALQDLSTLIRTKAQIKVIGVTGSNGKTTTKEWISQLSQLFFKTHKTKGTQNNHIGVPLTLFSLRKTDQVAVVEMGMSALGEISRLAEIALPDIGVVTNVNPSHLESLKCMENVFVAKNELVQGLKKEGIAILNQDDPYVAKMVEKAPCRVVTFGTRAKADYRAKNIKNLPGKGILFDLVVEDKLVVPKVKIKQLGRHNVLNALAAIAVVHQMGSDLEVLAKACSKLTLPSMRLELGEKEGIYYINDAYNANPTSMEVALTVLEDLEAEGKKIFVCGDMLELGMHSDLAHEELGQKVYDSKVDVLIAYGHLSSKTAQKAIDCGMEPDNVFLCIEKKGISDLLQRIASPGDVVLLKGSRRNQLEEVLTGWRDKSEELRV